MIATCLGIAGERFSLPFRPPPHLRRVEGAGISPGGAGHCRGMNSPGTSPMTNHYQVRGEKSLTAWQPLRPPNRRATAQATAQAGARDRSGQRSLVAASTRTMADVEIQDGSDDEEGADLMDFIETDRNLDEEKELVDPQV